MNQWTILWDMDGVLADTAEAHYKTWSKFLAEKNIAYTYDEFKQFFGMKNQDFLPIILGYTPSQELLNQYSDAKEKAFRDSINGNVHIFPGVLELLQQFKKWGFKQAVASSAVIENIDAVIDALNLRSYFDALVTPTGIASKPEPDIFLHAAKVLEASPDHCLVIEDSLHGITAGKRAHMKVLAVATSYPPERLKEADKVVDRLSDLTEDDIKKLLHLLEQ
ncbi:MAG TPA: HAD family phosphatase [Longilinea sp.]|nr:HAD family phosphatase [Longilinea sp.]